MAVCKPRLLEMAGIVGLQRLVEFTERSYLHGGGCFDDSGVAALGCDESGALRYLPDPDEWERSCRAYFHRAVYRVLLAGSILAGWHIEPFASEGVPNRLPPDIPANLRLFLANYPGTEDDPWEGGLEDQDITYLERFLPFDQEANTRVSEKQDALFGLLGRWLIQSMKKNIAPADLEWASSRISRNGNRWGRELNLSGFRDGSIDEGKVILREVMRMLVAFENLAKPFCNFDQKFGHGRWWNEEAPDLPIICSGWKTFAIILGVYQMEQVQFSEEDGGVATPVGRLPDGCSLGPVPEKAVDILNVQQYLYHTSGRSNHVDGYEAAPPRLQLFTFLLGRFFDLQFQQGHLWRVDKYQDYLQFLSDGAIFTNNLMSDGTGILANFSGPPVYSFRALD